MSIQLGLAPMEGVTNLATRLWFALTSRPRFAMTPFLRVTPGYPSKRISQLFAPELNTLKDAVPYRLIPQIMSSQAQDISPIAEYFLQFTPFIDINCGCPSPTVVGHHAGSGLLKTPDIFYHFTQELKKQIGNQQVSIKMRSGFESDAEYPALLEIVNTFRPAQLTLHARTRSDGYKKQARWELIQNAAQSCLFPVVGSGDVCSYNLFSERLQYTPGVQRFIIGRGALRNPWIFHEIQSATPVTISLSTLIYALAVFALLHEIELLFPDQIFALAEKQFFFSDCGACEEKWRVCYHTLSQVRYGRIIDVMSVEVERTSFAKLKMLWNYMRSSLPERWMEPMLFRSQSFAQFAEILSGLSKSENQNVFSLLHQSRHDWIYSGEKK